ncbi:MAG: DUF521 domain-containing protein [Firmicutes bacterium]|nr:DUF521 domain-containing protein [Bacillota bacterium]
MNLNRLEQDMLEGKRGEAVRLAMSIITTMGELYGATRMIPVTQAHIDGCSYAAVWDAGLEFAEKLAALGARVAVPTTLNITARDIEDWRQFRIPEDHALACERMEAAYHAMGCIPTWTCAPYQYALAPGFGQQIAWAESNAINFANSVLGARTHRYGDLVDICCAIAGRVPEFGLHLKENRAGQVLIRFEGIEASVWNDNSIYAAAGYLAGEIAGERVPVLDGLPASTTHENLKALSAASASSGAVGLFHVVGVTPEAPSLDEAFQGRRPAETVVVDGASLRSATRSLTSIREGGSRTAGEAVDLVIVGCPHSSYMEVESVL